MPQIQIEGGQFQNALGQPVSNGTLVLQLNEDCQVPSANNQIVSAAPLTIPLEVNGNVAAASNVQIWPNALMLPSNSYYQATVIDNTGTQVFAKIQNWYFTNTSPTNLGTITQINPGGLGVPDVVLTNPSTTQTINGADLQLDNGTFDAFRIAANQGTALPGASLILSGSWGSGAAVTGGTIIRDGGGRLQVTSGTGAGTNPTVTIVFGTPWLVGVSNEPPLALMTRVDTAGPSSAYWIQSASNATQTVLTFVGSPADTTNYSVNILFVGM